MPKTSANILFAHRRQTDYRPPGSPSLLSGATVCPTVYYPLPLIFLKLRKPGTELCLAAMLSVGKSLPARKKWFDHPLALRTVGVPSKNLWDIVPGLTVALQMHAGSWKNHAGCDWAL